MGTFGKIASSVLGGAIGGSIYRKADLAKQQKDAANAITPVDYNSLDDPLLQEQQASARLAATSGLAGGAALRRSIFQNQANTTAGVSRNAVSSGQAIAVAAANMANTNAALGRLQTAEATDQQRKEGVLSGILAQQGALANSDRYRKYMTARSDKAKLMAASLQNEEAAYDEPLQLASSIAGMYFGGGGGSLGRTKSKTG